ncbi:MAG: M28 family peptidase [Planctomycetes bacterium]|nr:M28 family peptidase [Planctomycetota bacterium]
MKSYIFGVVVLLGSIWLVLLYSSGAPLESFHGPGGPITSEEQEAADRIEATVQTLSQDIGPRGAHAPGSQDDIDRYLQREFTRIGVNAVEFPLEASGNLGKAFEVVVPGRGLGRETILLTAHLDSAAGSPGADDNASGVAVLLEMLRTLSVGCDRTLRVVFWSGGAAPLGGTEGSTAAAYANRLHSRHEKVAVAFCFDSLGVFCDAEGTQSIPFPFEFSFPARGDFVAFVGDWGTRGAMDHAVEQFRAACKFPSEAISLPSSFGFISEFDDGALRDSGYPALRVTDTGTLRNPVVGTHADLPTILDYPRMARLSQGLAAMVLGLGKRTITLM